MQTQAGDFYAVLGVPPSADAAAIRRAFRALARELHPDVSDAPDAHERFREVSEAYQVLSKPGAKLLYDRFGYRGGHVPVAVAEPLLDLWRRSRRRRRGEQTIDVVLDFVEAERGATRVVDVEGRAPCAACSGTGAAGAVAHICAACAGSGRVKAESAVAGARLVRFAACAECGGSGRAFDEACSVCDGAGESSAARSVRVRLPAGIRDGARIRLDDVSDELTDDVFVEARVLAAPADPAWIRYGSIVALLGALAFLVYLATRF